MLPNIEILKKDVINALSKFKEEGNMLEYSCCFVSGELTERYRKTFLAVSYVLTPEALSTSEHKDTYNKNLVTEKVKANFPFSKGEHSKEKEKQLREHFCELTIRNLKTGLFDLDVITYDEPKQKILKIRLILGI